MDLPIPRGRRKQQRTSTWQQPSGPGQLAEPSSQLQPAPESASGTEERSVQSSIVVLAAAALAEADAKPRQQQSALAESVGAPVASGAQEAGSGSEAQSVISEPAAAGANRWQALSVSCLKVGDRLWVFRQEPARHTGISIQEQITEK